MPFAGYADFDACVRANSDKDDPNAYCATIQQQVEGKNMETKSLECPNCREHNVEEVKYEGADAPRFHQCMDCGERFSKQISKEAFPTIPLRCPACFSFDIKRNSKGQLQCRSCEVKIGIMGSFSDPKDMQEYETAKDNMAQEKYNVPFNGLTAPEQDEVEVQTVSEHKEGY